MTRRLLRCPTCRQQIGTNGKWWPMLPPHSQPGEAVCCPGVCTWGDEHRNGRWRPARQDPT